MPSTTERILFGAAVVALVTLSFLRRDELQCDDAFITFRYARNLAEGHGLVFNPGERVEGYSNLLHTLLLAAGAAAGASPILGANVLGAVAGIALLLLLPAFAEVLGATPRRGMGAALALGLTASFQGWTSRGLETVPFAALLAGGLLLVCRGLAAAPPDRSVVAGAALLGLASVSRPEGIAYAGLAGLAILGGSGSRVALRALPALAVPFLGQLLFRILYYGDLFPNPYYVKLAGRDDRYRRGLDYVRAFAESSPLLALLIVAALVAAVASRRAPRILVAAATATGIAFAVSTGGESYPDVRFLVPVLPLAILLVAVAVPGRPGALVAAALAPIVLLSPAGATVPRTLARVIGPALAGEEPARAFLRRRAAELAGPVDEPMTRVGLRLRQELGPDALLAIADAGRIPFASRLPIVDLAGLMDRHIARLPGTARADVGYVLGREPDAIAVHVAGFWFAGPMDHMLIGSRRMLEDYRLGHVLANRRSAYLFFLRRPGAVTEPFVDVTGWAGPGEKSARSATGPVPADGLVVPVFRHTSLQPDEKRRIADLVARGASTPAELAALDGAIRGAAEATHHGIRFDLPPGVLEVTLEIAVRSPGALSRFEATTELLAGEAAPGLVLEAACGDRTARAAPGERLALDFPDVPSEELLVRVRRGGPASERVQLLACTPELAGAGSSSIAASSGE